MTYYILCLTANDIYPVCGHNVFFLAERSGNSDSGEGGKFAGFLHDLFILYDCPHFV